MKFEFSGIYADREKIGDYVFRDKEMEKKLLRICAACGQIWGDHTGDICKEE